MSSRRAARAAGKQVPTGVPPELLLECVPGGFWDNRTKVEAWLDLHGLGPVPEPFFALPPGLRQECIDQWATRQGLVSKYGHVNRPKLEELGIKRGPGRYHVWGRHSHMLPHAELNSWRNSLPPF